MRPAHRPRHDARQVEHPDAVEGVVAWLATVGRWTIRCSTRSPRSRRALDTLVVGLDAAGWGPSDPVARVDRRRPDPSPGGQREGRRPVPRRPPRRGVGLGSARPLVDAATPDEPDAVLGRLALGAGRGARRLRCARRQRAGDLGCRPDGGAVAGDGAGDGDLGPRSRLATPRWGRRRPTPIGCARSPTWAGAPCPTPWASPASTPTPALVRPRPRRPPTDRRGPSAIGRRPRWWRARRASGAASRSGRLDPADTALVADGPNARAALAPSSARAYLAD